VVVPRGKSETLSTSDSIQRPSEVFQDWISLFLPLGGSL
jgi:hypothetical protein